MITFKCLGTGSSGNCYVLDDGETIILLDAGIPLMDIKVGINFQVSRLKMVCITHTHKDHLYANKDLSNMGITVLKPFEKEVPYIVHVGRFAIQTFELTDANNQPVHTNADGSPCRVFGYLVSHPDMGRLLYITDAMLIKYRFKNINTLLLGVNYSEDCISEDIDEGKRWHIGLGHMELNTAKGFVAEMVQTNNLTNIILCHLSESNADPKKFKETIEEVTTGENVIIARKGMVL